MKKHVFKSFALITMLFSAMTISAASGVDWSAYEFLGDGAGGGTYSNKYKISTAEGMSVVNIQIPGFTQEPSIYATVPAGISDCNVSSTIQGAGIALHLSAFTAKETQVTINYAGGSCTFWVYYADGTEGGSEGGEEPDPTPDPEEPEVTDKWASLNWLGNGSGLPENTDKYKISQNCLREVVNIQKPGFADEVGIYVVAPGAIESCTVNGAIQGTGMVLYLSSFTAKETEVTINYAGGSCTFWVYYADGSGDAGGSGGSDLPIPSTGPSNVNWESFAWVPKNQCETCENQYKVETNNGCVIRADNIQDRNQNMSIYCVTAQVVTDCNIAYTSEGTGIWLHLSGLTSRETEVTLKFADGSTCSFWVLNDKAEPADDPDQPVEEGVCTYEGGPGDALMEEPGRDQFKSGYRITLTLDEADPDKIHITATVLGADAPAETAIFQNYPYYDYAQNTAEHKFPGSKQSTFETTISISSLLKDNIADGIIRFAIKFEYDGVIKVTTPEFFYLDGSGCAQRVFAIYHHDDLPAEPLEGEDQFTEFAGGRILQSIQYKRRMPSEVWETLSVPFDVDSVTAFDPATGKHVYLYAQYNNGSTQEGNYWLRYFKTKEVTASNFQPNWYDIEATSKEAAKPVKDKAYIIRLPNGGGYYNDKYIVFHGRGYQTIADTYNAPDLPADDYYSYSGNNTMMPQYLSSAYVLDNAGYYFTSSSTVTLPPFECSVNATAATIAKMPRIALNGRNNTTTDLTLLPTTDLQGGVIYSIFGAAVARFNTIDEYDQACQTLAAGVYVIVTPSATTKIQIP